MLIPLSTVYNVHLKTQLHKHHYTLGITQIPQVSCETIEDGKSKLRFDIKVKAHNHTQDCIMSLIEMP